jgi:hypothetical protein
MVRKRQERKLKNFNLPFMGVKSPLARIAAALAERGSRSSLPHGPKENWDEQKDSGDR